MISERICEDSDFTKMPARKDDLKYFIDMLNHNLIINNSNNNIPKFEALNSGYSSKAYEQNPYREPLSEQSEASSLPEQQSKGPRGTQNGSKPLS